MYVFLCHFIKVLLVSNKSTFLCPPLWYWILQTTCLSARAGRQGRQQRALETLQIRRDFSLFSCLAFLVGGKWLWLQGSWQRCQESWLFSGRQQTLQSVSPLSPLRSDSVSSLLPCPSASGRVTVLCSHVGALRYRRQQLSTFLR